MTAPAIRERVDGRDDRDGWMEGWERPVMQPRRLSARLGRSHDSIEACSRGSVTLRRPAAAAVAACRPPPGLPLTQAGRPLVPPTLTLIQHLHQVGADVTHRSGNGRVLSMEMALGAARQPVNAVLVQACKARRTCMRKRRGRRAACTRPE